MFAWRRPHLRGGHYVVSGDLNLVIRLSQVSRYVVAQDPQEAEKILRESSQLRSSGIDLAVFANGWRALQPAPKADDKVTIRGEVHNLGMETASGWKVQFHDGDPAKGGSLISESPLEAIEAGDVQLVDGIWKATPGEHRIFATVIPPGGVKDLRDTNNQVSPGNPDRRRHRTPGRDRRRARGKRGPSPPGKVLVRGTVSDNVGVARLEYAADGGLWTTVEPRARWETSVDLAKGQHSVRVRATDTSGNVSEQTRLLRAE